MTTPIRDPGETPGESEFSWGSGVMPDPKREPPQPYHELKATHRTNRHSDEPDYVETFEGEFGG
jgi:hypothetical protein